MKAFFKNVLANIVAILILCLTFFLISIVMIGIATAGSDGNKPIEKQTVLVLNDKISIVDSPTENQDDIFSYSKSNNTVYIYDLVKAIEHAKTDEKVSGISIETDQINAGLTHLSNLRSALIDFKKSGKFVYAYGNTQNQASYYLASVADKVYLHPTGSIDLKGLASENLFFKDFADKYGIGVEIIRHGKFKAAVEPYFRNEMSEENRLQTSTLLNDLWKNISNDIAANRKLSPEKVNTITDSLYGLFPEKVVANKMVDQLIQKPQYEELLKEKLALKGNKKLNRLNISDYVRSIDINDYNTNQVAILYASGAIYSGEGYTDIYSENYLKEIKRLQEDENVKAVVLRINSPGGSANASDEILFALKDLKTKKPLIVSFGDYAASGGYYIAMAADKIYAEKNTITGSIGAFGVLPYFKEIANRNGIHSEIVKTNANSDYLSSIEGLTPYGKRVMNENVSNTYNRFVTLVSQNRKKNFRDIDAVGEGRVWSGERAKSIGLVDEIGSLSDAIKYAAKKANLSKYDVSSFPKKQSLFNQIFNAVDSDNVTSKILEKKFGKENYQLVEQVLKVQKSSQIQMLNTLRVKY